jgi:hypothetical protein
VAVFQLSLYMMSFRTEVRDGEDHNVVPHALRLHLLAEIVEPDVDVLETHEIECIVGIEASHFGHKNVAFGTEQGLELDDSRHLQRNQR